MNKIIIRDALDFVRNTFKDDYMRIYISEFLDE